MRSHFVQNLKKKINNWWTNQTKQPAINTHILYEWLGIWDRMRLTLPTLRLCNLLREKKKIIHARRLLETFIRMSSTSSPSIISIYFNISFDTQNRKKNCRLHDHLSNDWQLSVQIRHEQIQQLHIILRIEFGTTFVLILITSSFKSIRYFFVVGQNPYWFSFGIMFNAFAIFDAHMWYSHYSIHKILIHKMNTHTHCQYQ